MGNICSLDGRVPVLKSVPFRLQHVLAMFVANIAPIMIVAGAGGHGMVFTDKDGKLRLTYHTPNTKGSEHPHFVSVEDIGDSIVIG